MVKSATGAVHKTKASANQIAKILRRNGIKCTIRKLKNGWRVDKS